MEQEVRTVLVLGANGRFGRAAVEAFSRGGWQVLAQIRRPAPTLLPADVRSITLPLQDTAALAAAARDASVVVHAINPLYTDWERTVLPLGRLAMDLAERLGAALMLPGNVYNFGSRMPDRLEAATPQRPDTPKGRLRATLEAEMAERGRRGLRSVVIRAGDFYGAGRGNWFDQAIVKALPRGRLVYPGPRDVRHAWAYLPDLAQAFVAVAEAGIVEGCADLPFPGNALTGEEMLSAIEEAARDLDLAPPGGFRRAALPWGVIRVAGLVVPLWRALAEMSYLWRVPHALDGAALAERIGTLPATPLALALRASLRALYPQSAAPAKDRTVQPAAQSR
jgi:nucleoside-diphosphate-sugar epimerase